MEYKLHLDNFEGPLELLYQLVKENEIEISRISLAKITDQYLDYLHHMQSFDIDKASEFSVIAAELLELKASTLLPQNTEEEKDEDSKDIVDRLKAYKKFKKAAKKLSEYKNRADKIYFRETDFKYENTEITLNLNISINEFKKSYKQALESSENKNTKDTDLDEINYIQQEKFKVEEKTEEILKILDQFSSGIYFQQLINKKDNLMEIIVTLLSILELIRMKKVFVNQQKIFSKIEIYPETKNEKGKVIG